MGKQQFRIPCGKGFVDILLPQKSVVPVAVPEESEPLIDPAASLMSSLRLPIGSKPLADLADGRGSAVIVVSDSTRPVPNVLFLKGIIQTLQSVGISEADITILIGAGLHRKATEDELKPLNAFGCRVVCHDARNPDMLKYIGETSGGVPVWINKAYLEADLKIVTGLIEPHFMAGFSGGRKGICPAIVGAETIKAFHSPELMDHPQSRTANLEGNPVHMLSEEIAGMAGIDFLVNVTIDRERNITGVFTGNWKEAFSAGALYAMRELSRSYAFPADLVITSSAGWPLDATFYQTVKGICAGAMAVRTGGAVLVIAGCEEGIGSLEYEKAMRSAPSCREFLNMVRDPHYYCIDQWQIQKHCQAGEKAKIYFYSPGLDRETLKDLLVEPVDDPQGFVDEFLQMNPEADVAVIPEGPYVIPVIEHQSEMEIYTVG